MTETSYDVVVIGGGPAGLTAAWELRDRNILLLERSHRLGGRLYSVSRGDMWMNFGGHLFPAPDSRLRRLVAEVGLETIAIPGNTFALLFGGKVRSPSSVTALPLTLPLSARERIALARVGLRIRRAVKGWQKEMQPRPGEASDKRRARVARFMSTTRFSDYLGPMPERIEALFRAAGQRTMAEIEDVSAGAGASLFGMVWAGRGSAMAVNLMGGSGRLGEVMTERLGKRAVLEAMALNVERQGRGIRVTYEKGGRQQTVSAAQAIVAVPATEAAGIVQGLPGPLRQMLGRVSYAPFPTMGVITDETDPRPWDDLYAITVPGATINMMFNHSNPLRRPGVPKKGSSFMVYSGGKPAAEMMRLSQEQIRDRYLADMFTVFPELRPLVQEAQVQKWVPGNTYRPAGFDFSAMLDYCDRTDTDIHFAGDYFAELGNMETASGTGYEAALRAKARLSERGVRPAAA